MYIIKQTFTYQFISVFHLSRMIYSYFLILKSAELRPQKEKGTRIIQYSNNRIRITSPIPIHSNISSRYTIIGYLWTSPFLDGTVFQN